MIKIVKFIPLIVTWIIVLINVVHIKKRKLYLYEGEDDKKIDIYNTVMFAICISLLYVLFILSDKYLLPFLLNNKAITSFLLRWGIHAAFLILILELVKFILNIENRCMLIFFLPIFLFLTGHIVDNCIVPIINSNLKLVLSISVNMMLGILMLIVYRGILYIRNVV